MTNKEAKGKKYMEWQKFLEDNIDYAGISDAYKTAFKALEQEPCEDAVSRQYLIDIATEDGAYDYVSAQEIANAPSVNPQPKTGHWIKTSSGFKCSKCLIVHPHTSLFCPSCGAKMIEPQGI